MALFDYFPHIQNFLEKSSGHEELTQTETGKNRSQSPKSLENEIYSYFAIYVLFHSLCYMHVEHSFERFPAFGIGGLTEPCLFVCLIGFLTSSSATRLSSWKGPKTDMTSDNFTCYHTRDRGGRPGLLSQPVTLH